MHWDPPIADPTLVPFALSRWGAPPLPVRSLRYNGDGLVELWHGQPDEGT
eukprot:gene28133-24356_t